VEVV